MRRILATHHHADHVGGISRLVEAYDVPVYGPAAEQIPARTVALRDGDQVELSPLHASFSVLEVPGHTAGHIAYVGAGMAFVGDTLFMSGCGRLFEGTAAQMLNSLSRLASLPGDTLIYCAHEYTLDNLKFARAVEPENGDILQRTEASNDLRRRHQPTVPAPLSLELKTNPFLRTAQPTVAAAAAAHAGHHLGNQAEIFAAVRGWKDQF